MKVGTKYKKILVASNFDVLPLVFWYFYGLKIHQLWDHVSQEWLNRSGRNCTAIYSPLSLYWNLCHIALVQPSRRYMVSKLLNFWSIKTLQCVLLFCCTPLNVHVPLKFQNFPCTPLTWNFCRNRTSLFARSGIFLTIQL